MKEANAPSDTPSALEKPPVRVETMRPEFQAKAMFDNYAEHTLKASREVRFYKRLKTFWLLLTTVLVYVWARAYFYDKSYRNNCQVEVTEAGEVVPLIPDDYQVANPRHVDVS